MNGKSAFGGLVLLSIGLTAGWYGRGWQHTHSQQPIRTSPFDSISTQSESRESQTIKESFELWSTAPELSGALLGYCVLDESGNLLYGSPLAKTALCPASALKTLTAGAAFGVLGPDFRFTTKVMSSSNISPEGEITGNIVITGSGDPSLTRQDIEALANDLIKEGLKHITGTVSSNASIFPSEPVNEHWNWGDIGNAYGTGAYGLNVDHNVMSVWFDPGEKIGDPAKFGGSIPLLKDISWVSSVTTGSVGSGDQVMILSSPYADTIRLSGTVPLGEKEFTVRGSVPNPPELAKNILRDALLKKGVTFGEKISSSPSTVEIVSHDSIPLAKIIDHMQEVSDNLEAQCLFLTMGNRANLPATDALKQYWEQAGIHFTGLRLIDGSGLARATMITPFDLAMVNLHALKGPHGERFLQSLPANHDATMRSKRGAMSGVKTEVGFIIRGKKRYTFALMANGLNPSINFWNLRKSLLENIGQ